MKQQLINTNAFLNLIKKQLNSEFIITGITTNDINEFKIGKSYFYTIKNQEKFIVMNNGKKYNIYDVLNAWLSHNVLLNNASIAFRKELSYLHFFEQHRKNFNFIRLDIRSFFHSISIDDIRDVFKHYFNNDFTHENMKQDLVDAFINLVTYKIPQESKNEKFRGKQVLPMGFKTSPIISNIIFRQLDIQIQKLCLENNITYTRYADDMLFSSVKNNNYIHSDNFVQQIRIIISQMKFQLNEHKMIKAQHTLSLNGYTIDFKNKELRFSNKKTHIIKKLISKINKEKKDPDEILKKLFQYKIKWNFKPDRFTYEKYNIEQLLNKVIGYRSYLLSIIKFNKKYHCTEVKTIDKYLVIINDLEKIIDIYMDTINKLNEKIEKKKEGYNNALLKGINELSFTDWQKKVLQDAGYLTLKNLKGINVKQLSNKIDGIGEVKAKKIIKIINQELVLLRKTEFEPL